jgi:hypothetical protein
MKKIYFKMVLIFLCLSCQNSNEKKEAAKQELARNSKVQLEFPTKVLIQRPNFEGNVLTGESKNFPKLKLASKKQNQIIDDEDWFNNNNISLPMYTVFNGKRGIKGNLPKTIPIKYKNFKISKGFKYNDCNVFFFGNNFRESRFAIITDEKSTKIEHFLDFKNFNYAPKILEGKEKFVFQSIQWAVKESNILFISHGHSTYAKYSAGKNAYISAIDLETYKILWTTKPLTCNSIFSIANNSIVCGYGFTDEKDYLFVLDKNTGSRIQKIKLDKGPSYVIQKENRILVRTYDQDYEFDIK